MFDSSEVRVVDSTEDGCGSEVLARTGRKTLVQRKIPGAKITAPDWLAAAPEYKVARQTNMVGRLNDEYAIMLIKLYICMKHVISM